MDSSAPSATDVLLNHSSVDHWVPYLRCCVHRHQRQRLQFRAWRYVDYGASLPLQHLRQYHSCHRHCGTNVDVDNVPQLLFRHFAQVHRVRILFAHVVYCKATQKTSFIVLFISQPHYIVKMQEVSVYKLGQVKAPRPTQVQVGKCLTSTIISYRRQRFCEATLLN